MGGFVGSLPSGRDQGLGLLGCAAARKGGWDRELLHGPISTMMEKKKTENLVTKEQPAAKPAVEKVLTLEEIVERDKKALKEKEALWAKKRDDAVKKEHRDRVVAVELLNGAKMVNIGGGMHLEDGGIYEVSFTTLAKMREYEEARHFKFITMAKVPEGTKPIKLSPKK